MPSFNQHVDLRNSQAARVEAECGPSPRVQLRTGSKPAGGPGVARTGTLLVEITLAVDWLSAPSGGVVTLIGTPFGGAESGPVYPLDIGHWSILLNDRSKCVLQGDVGEGLTVDTVTVVVAGQVVTVLTFTYTAPNP